MRRFFLALTILIASLGAARAGGVDIITSPENATVQLDRKMIRSIFSMRLRQWPDGGAVRVFVLPDGHALHVRFCREHLGTYPYLLRSTWDRLIYTGTGSSPQVVSDEQEMRRRVRNTPGAIGYITGGANPDALSANRFYMADANGGAR